MKEGIDGGFTRPPPGTAFEVETLLK